MLSSLTHRPKLSPWTGCLQPCHWLGGTQAWHPRSSLTEGAQGWSSLRCCDATMW